MVQKNPALALLDQQCRLLHQLAKRLRNRRRTSAPDCLFCSDPAAAPAGKRAQWHDIQKEYQDWLLRTGLSEKSAMPVSRSGLYTDFT